MISQKELKDKIRALAEILHGFGASIMEIHVESPSTAAETNSELDDLRERGITALLLAVGLRIWIADMFERRSAVRLDEDRVILFHDLFAFLKDALKALYEYRSLLVSGSSETTEGCGTLWQRTVVQALFLNGKLQQATAYLSEVMDACTEESPRQAASVSLLSGRRPNVLVPVELASLRSEEFQTLIWRHMRDLPAGFVRRTFTPRAHTYGFEGAKSDAALRELIHRNPARSVPFIGDTRRTTSHGVNRQMRERLRTVGVLRRHRPPRC